MKNSAESSSVGEWTKYADQLRRVDRDIRAAELKLAQGETVDESEDDFKVSLHLHLDSLKQERQEIARAMESQVTSSEPEPTPEARSEDPYRFAGKSINEIKNALRHTKGWEGARNRLEKHYKSQGIPASADDLLSEWARQVQSGLRGVKPGMWSEIYDRYSPAGEASSSRPEPKKSDPPSARADTTGEADRGGADSLPKRSVSGYDTDSTTIRSEEHMSSGETLKPEDPWSKVDTDTRDDLKDILKDTSTEDFYGSPTTGAAAETKKSTLDTALSRLSEEDRAATGDSRMPVSPLLREKMPQVARAQEAYERQQYHANRLKRAEAAGDTEEATRAKNSEHRNERQVNEYNAPTRELYEDRADSARRYREGYDKWKERGGAETVDPGVEIPGHLLEEIPEIESFEKIVADAQVLRDGLDTQIQAVAAAKESREKFWNLRRQKRVEKLGQEQSKLDSLHDEYVNAWAYKIAQIEGMDGEFDEASRRFMSEINITRDEIARVDTSDAPDDVKDIQKARLEKHIAEHQSAIAECQRRKVQAKEQALAMRAQMNIVMIQDLAEVRTRIEEEQSKLKEGTLSQKFKNMWRKHPVARTAIGVGLGVAGFVVAGPLGTAAGVAALGMRGAGGFMATEGGVNTVHKWRADRAERKAGDASYEGLDEEGKHRVDAGINSINGSNTEVGPDADQRRADVESFLRRHPMAQVELQKVLSGNPEASADIASQLIADQQARVSSDARSNRRAKIAGAVVGVGAMVIGQMWHSHGGSRQPGPPRDPQPGPPRGYNPDADRWVGMASENPRTMVPNWEVMHATATPEAVAAAKAAGGVLDRAYDSVSQGMSIGQLRQLNGIIGAGARTIGNEKVADLLPGIATQVKNGVPAERIMELYNIPTQIT